MSLYDLESERSVLGGILLENRMAYPAMQVLRADDFYRLEHQKLWGVMVEMTHKGEQIDLVTLIGKLRDRAILDDCGGSPQILSLGADTPSSANVEAYAKRVRDYSQRRKVVAFAQSLQDCATAVGGDELMGMASGSLNALLAHASAESVRFGDAFTDAQKTITLAAERMRNGGIVGAPSGLRSLDFVIGGFTGPRLVGLAARPGIGKTALLNQMAVHSSRNGYPGLIVSLEMGRDELVIRALASEACVNFSRVSRGHKEEADAAYEAGSALSELPLWLDTETVRLEAICAQIAMHRQRHGIQWAAVDHIGLVQTERFNSRNDQIGHISGTLKQLCKRLNMPIFALSQLSRASEKAGMRPGLSDLRDSGNVEQDLDIAIFLHTDAKDRQQPIKPLEIGVLKNRCGPTCWLQESFQFEGPTQTIREVYQPAQAVY